MKQQQRPAQVAFSENADHALQVPGHCGQVRVSTVPPIQRARTRECPKVRYPGWRMDVPRSRRALLLHRLGGLELR